MSKIMDRLMQQYLNQDVSVLHYDKITETYQKIAYVSVNKNLTLIEKLEQAFTKTNNIDCAWWENKEISALFAGKSCRSTSVGDIVMVDGKKYSCEDNGWKTLNGDIVK